MTEIIYREVNSYGAIIKEVGRVPPIKTKRPKVEYPKEKKNE